jgi:hypothetical protein
VTTAATALAAGLATAVGLPVTTTAFKSVSHFDVRLIITYAEKKIFSNALIYF